jgi:hypothetical protein
MYVFVGFVTGRRTLVARGLACGCVDSFLRAYGNRGMKRGWSKRVAFGGVSRGFLRWLGRERCWKGHVGV